MLGLFGRYDVLVAGAGVTGVTAAIAAAREGAQVLLVEGTGFVGGNVTAGRLTKPTGTIESGVFREMLERAAAMGGADTSVRATGWGVYTGMFDPEVMLRVMLAMLEEAKVEVLLHAHVTDVVADERVRGVEVLVKSGRKIILAGATVDASGDGDVAALAGADFFLGRPGDGSVQPMSCYVRMINVDTPALARYIREHPEDFTATVLPPEPSDDSRDYVFTLLATGFRSCVQAARAAGDWTLPKSYVTIKTGMLPGEVNLNITRFHGHALDERVLSRAEIELRKQAYEAVDALKKHLPGFADAALLDVAPKLGVRETRRIKGDYVLSAEDVKTGRRFPDSIGLVQSPIDIHEPGGEGGAIEGIATAYSVPYRCLLPKGVEGLLVAGRCISVDEVAFGATRNVPTCVLTGEAAGIAAALAARDDVTPRQLDVGRVQAALRGRAIPLGVGDEHVRN